MLDLLLALALLTSPPDTAEVLATAEAWSARVALRDLAVQWELMDERETKYTLVRPEDFAGDLRLLQRRYDDLHDAPPAADAARFPPKDVESEWLAFNRAYRQRLEDRQGAELWRFDALGEVVRECDRLYNLHDAVRDAQTPYFYVTVRRQALKRLRDVLGPQAYYRGELPPHVPVGCFQRID